MIVASASHLTCRSVAVLPVPQSGRVISDVGMKYPTDVSSEDRTVPSFVFMCVLRSGSRQETLPWMPGREPRQTKSFATRTGF